MFVHIQPMASPPQSEAELLSRARALAGVTLGELSTRLGLSAPPDLRRAKGFVGQVVEAALGATAGSRAQPDFAEIGVELKTLPVDRRGRPAESTFVCTIDLGEVGDVEWEHSWVRRKLSRVLWVPVEGERSILPQSATWGNRSCGARTRTKKPPCASIGTSCRGSSAAGTWRASPGRWGK